MNQRFPGPSELSADEQNSMLISIEKRVKRSTAVRTRRRIVGIAVLGSLLAGTTTVAAYGAISEQLLETPESIASPDPATAAAQAAILEWTGKLHAEARVATGAETGNTR